MIFKYCTWPEEAKETDKATVLKNGEPDSIERDQNFNEEIRRSRKREYKIANTVLRYCPCAFRCRQPVDVEKDEEDSVSTIITTANTTPVIPLRLNRCSDTIDKAVNEEECNEKNQQHFVPEDNFGDLVHPSSEGEDREISSPEVLENTGQQNAEHDAPDTQDDSDSASSSSERQNDDTAFDIITGQSSPPGRDTVDFIVSIGSRSDTVPEVPVDDDGCKEWSSEEEAKFSENRSRAGSRNSGPVELSAENQNESEFSTSDETGRTDETLNPQGVSAIPVSVPEPEVADENLQTSGDIFYANYRETAESSPLRKSASPSKSSRPASRNSGDSDASQSPRNSRRGSRKLSFQLEDKESVNSSEERPGSSATQCDNDSIRSEEPSRSRRVSRADESPAIIIASRPHSSNEVSSFIESHAEVAVGTIENDNPPRFVSESNESGNLEDEQIRDSSSETNTEPGILKIETEPVEKVATTKRKLLRIPQARGRSKGNSDKTKPIVQQCFAQLESKDWEINIKGLKALSQIAKQQPECLDVNASATINRLLGRQIKSLRSQVARTACSTAGDIFSCKIRGIDQDFDDIAGPLLHRTADTNKFLRADSNCALDRMVEHLPPNKTIGVIVQRGASHQNAIVRAATARLLTSVVDRMGPDCTLMLPKDVRDKLLFTGARLLMDGNLDARNHAKKMFRHLTHCDGFRKALIDAVPDTTLRHIDKTLKTL